MVSINMSCDIFLLTPYLSIWKNKSTIKTNTLARFSLLVLYFLCLLLADQILCFVVQTNLVGMNIIYIKDMKNAQPYFDYWIESYLTVH